MKLHYDCAGNPVVDEAHDADVAATAQAFKKELGFAGPVAALSTVRHANDSWSLKEVGKY